MTTDNDKKSTPYLVEEIPDIEGIEDIGASGSNLRHEEVDYLHIRRYGDDYFHLTNGEIYQNQPIAIYKKEVLTDILPSTFTALDDSYFEGWLNLKPEVILIGTGNTTHFLRPEWQAFFYQKKIGLEVMPTESLCRTFTILQAEERKALGLFFLAGE